MSLDHQYGRFVMCCDDCGERRVADFPNDKSDRPAFDAFIRGAKDDGWKITKDGDEWVHTCPDCDAD